MYLIPVDDRCGGYANPLTITVQVRKVTMIRGRTTQCCPVALSPSLWLDTKRRNASRSHSHPHYDWIPNDAMLPGRTLTLIMIGCQTTQCFPVSLSPSLWLDAKRRNSSRSHSHPHYDWIPHDAMLPGLTLTIIMIGCQTTQFFPVSLSPSLRLDAKWRKASRSHSHPHYDWMPNDARLPGITLTLIMIGCQMMQCFPVALSPSLSLYISDRDYVTMLENWHTFSILLTRCIIIILNVITLIWFACNFA